MCVIGPSIPTASAWSNVVGTWSPLNALRLYVNNALVTFTTSLANSYTASSLPHYVTLTNGLNGASVCNGGLYYDR